MGEQFKSTMIDFQVSHRSSFLLTPMMLKQLVGIIEARYQKEPGERDVSYHVELAGGTKYTLNTLDEVLGLDNAINNPIARLLVLARHGSQSSCTVNYSSLGSNDVGWITASVKEREDGFGRQLLANLDDQIKRTLVTGWIHKIKQRFSSYTIVFLTVLLIYFGFSFLAAFALPRSLNKQEILEALEQANSAVSLEEKVNFLFDLRRLELELRSESRFNLSSLLTWRTIAIGIVPLILLSSFIYLYRNCYPAAIFLWGDQEAHFERIKTIRSGIWQVIIVNLVIAIIGSTFVVGIWG